MDLSTPISVGAGAVYPYSLALEKKFTSQSRYGDVIELYKKVGKDRILLPRQVCPKGGQDLMAYGGAIKFTHAFKPRNPEQERVVMETIALLKKGANFIFQAPTGFGKTVCMMPVIAALGVKTAVVVTKEDIRDQWVKAAKDFLGLTTKDIGLIQGDVCDTAGKKLVICMIHSVCKSGRYSPVASTSSPPSRPSPVQAAP